MPDRDLVASPCTGVCTMNSATGWCQGCFRTIDEIVGWTALDAAGRLAVWDLLPRRRNAEVVATEPSAGRQHDEPARG